MHGSMHRQHECTQPMTTAQPTHHVHLRIEGRVQGVGFREGCVRQARTLGLDGWVRNRRDGSVEVMARGGASALAALEAWLHRGPPPARVDGVTPIARGPDGTDDLAAGFEFRDTL
jgi:acylphosphatase